MHFALTDFLVYTIKVNDNKKNNLRRNPTEVQATRGHKPTLQRDYLHCIANFSANCFKYLFKSNHF